VSKPNELDAAVKKIGLPAVLKTCRMGYDGKGQWILRTAEDVAKAKSELPAVSSQSSNASCLSRASFPSSPFAPAMAKRLSIRSSRTTIAAAFSVFLWRPLRASNLHSACRRKRRRQVLESLKYVGVLAIEFFEHDGRLLANEMAPRVHNSGHWTIEGAVTSQFEIISAPSSAYRLAPQGRRHCAMLNLIGELPESAEVLAVPTLISISTANPPAPAAN